MNKKLILVLLILLVSVSAIATSNKKIQLQPHFNHCDCDWECIEITDEPVKDCARECPNDDNKPIKCKNIKIGVLVGDSD